MSAKLKLNLDERLPDFDLPVKFQLPNGNEMKINFIVRHLSGEEIQDLYKNSKEDKDFIMALATGWDVVQEFNESNAARLINLYPAAAIALSGTYMQALAGYRVKN
ncbi:MULTISPECIES: phage tail assembly chaperone [Gammaproteobacteria]|uniref:phage tail assembly chaperone n=1 Tax=Gammaproteobacteria TaxID=1236 RepID=UPI002FCB4D1D